MIRKRFIIVSLIIALVCVCTITGRPLKRAQAATITNSWTWDFSQDNITYQVYEYSDCRFVVVENNGGSMRTITGHPYLTYNGDAKAAVDTTTKTYWNSVTQKFHDENLRDALRAIYDLTIDLPNTIINIVKSLERDIVGVGIDTVTGAARTYGLTGDRAKVSYEIVVCAKAACDLSLTPGITIPTETTPSAGA